MRKKSELRRSVIGLVILAVLIVGFILWNYGIRTDIKQDVTLDIYENGVVVGETAVHMDGTRANHLFGHDDRFAGRFEIELAERTCHAYSSASITWPEDGRQWQTILYFNSGDSFFKEFGLNHCILINPEMTEMAIQLTDGRVLASSETMYEIYTEHFEYDAETGTVTITDGIPEF